MFTENEIKVFRGSLQSGFGFTKSCFFQLKEPAVVSSYIHDTPEFKQLCEDAIKEHATKLIQMNMKALSELDFNAFIKQNGYATRFIAQLTLWEDFSTADKIDPDNFMKAVYLYRYPEEVATACGLTMANMWDFIKRDEMLSTFLSEIGFV